jgi:hypothetical protein
MGLGVLLVPLGVPRLDLVDERGLRRDTAPQALTAQMAEFDLRHVEPTAVFRSRMDLSFIRDAFRLRRIKGFIQRSFGVGMQIVHHETNLLHVGIMLINKFFDKMRPILGRPNRRLAVDRFLNSRCQSRLSDVWWPSIFNEKGLRWARQLRTIAFFISD